MHGLGGNVQILNAGFSYLVGSKISRQYYLSESLFRPRKLPIFAASNTHNG
jgi:hypothetical protein